MMNRSTLLIPRAGILAVFLVLVLAGLGSAGHAQEGGYVGSEICADCHDDVAGAFDEQGSGAIVNNSRGIIFAYAREPYAEKFGSRWQQAIEAATLDMIEQLRAETPAGKLPKG